MPYAWSSDLETGNASIDNQHRQLIGALNELFDAHQSGKGRQEVESALDFMMAYATQHFTDEEKLQTACNYPGYLTHKRLHDEFIRMVQGLAKNISSLGSTDDFITNVHVKLGEWLHNHIMGEDAKMAAYIQTAKQQGASQENKAPTFL